MYQTLEHWYQQEEHQTAFQPETELFHFIILCILWLHSIYYWGFSDAYLKISYSVTKASCCITLDSDQKCVIRALIAIVEVGL